MDFGSEVGHQRKSGKLVLIVVVLGIAVLGAGVFVLLKKRSAASNSSGPGVQSAPEGIGKWCALRTEWAKKVTAIEPDIMLKSIKAEDAEARKKLEAQRRGICSTYAAKVKRMKVADDRIQKVEAILYREGTIRANVAVQIHNKLVELDKELVSKNIKLVREGLVFLEETLKKKITKGRSDATQKIQKTLAGLKGCDGIYRGPVTAKGTSDDPYTSWNELEFRLKSAQTRFKDQIRVLEPMEQYANHIRHELIRRYRRNLKTCWKQTLRKNRKASPQVGVLIRLRGNGKVKTMGIATMPVREEKILDCLLAKAPKWRLPAPAKDGDSVIVNLDFSSI